ncbi:hypothetical protein TCAL_11448 [Tigriopus californicus]|uniref:Phosphatidic acid phosphatase type 2/haloperoxidase domain-containing protein n=1 Tax=Tigriopus californicus TaxID=6832 RepID=A0A553P1V0_TIGCA|nr:phospholipid phosphatase 5-like [Tigriopus californicus]TRY71667.1 hypothetical protein TCAL_11448 [Tigriopus californicus]|eukprot:TCALIF_11448-PA protein Name:"Similar to Ppapdc1a Phosphatidate phosphatase PPAPDC1A (Mus musculus)" AED:0.01 eAED:0.01 QI:240/1/1/1/1/1/2/331/319
MRKTSLLPSILSRLLQEASLRLFLLILFIYLEYQEPFHRVIHQEEAYLYSNPTTISFFPVVYLWLVVVFVPALTILCVQIFHRIDILDLLSAVLCVSLVLLLNGVLTNIIKLSVGRPRPDFMSRCWPDGNVPPSTFDDPFNQHFECTGNLAKILDGRKSFPSGHSSFAFATFGFVFFYVSGKLRTFARDPSLFFQSHRFLISIFTLIMPLAIAVSRTCDYHHHWQDVVVGSLLGFGLAGLVYGLYFPSLTSRHCDQCLVTTALTSSNQYEHGSVDAKGDNGRGGSHRFLRQSLNDDDVEASLNSNSPRFKPFQRDVKLI